MNINKMVLLVFRMTRWIIRVILDMCQKYGETDGYIYECQGESVAPDIIRQVRNRKKWRVSRWAWRLAWVVFILLAALAMYCAGVMWGLL